MSSLMKGACLLALAVLVTASTAQSQEGVTSGVVELNKVAWKTINGSATTRFVGGFVRVPRTSLRFENTVASDVLVQFCARASSDFSMLVRVKIDGAFLQPGGDQGVFFGGQDPDVPGRVFHSSCMIWTLADLDPGRHVVRVEYRNFLIAGTARLGDRTLLVWFER